MKTPDLVNALIRPYIASLFATAITIGWLYGRLSDDAFMGVAGIAIGFFFQRRDERRNDAPPDAK